MATALQQQLATIAAKSTHQLDLKAQKARHSQSLLFQPREAATQSFDTIFQICSEGFEELCALDSRFRTFGRNLFSEQSKYEDRAQMTKRENSDLDEVVERFLGLLCGRLLLKPAMKAVEWLVRRFHAQEFTAECLLLTFLPYHTSHIFPTLLSILPEQLPSSCKWLHPYVASLQSPPRYAVLSATISNAGFFSAFNQYVLKVARARHHSAILLGFWASITAQAVNGMFDASRSGRDSIRKEREEDLLLRILPVLQSALSVNAILELYLGACMIMTILATKASLDDKVYDAMMEAIAGAWTDQTMEEGMTCLAVIAEEKQTIRQPSSTTRAILKRENLLQTLSKLAKSQRINKLVVATAFGALEHACKHRDIRVAHFLTHLLNANILPEHYTLLVLERLLISRRELSKDNSGTDVYNVLSSFLASFAGIETNAGLLEQAVRKAKVDLRELGLQPSLLPRNEDSAAESVPLDAMEVETKGLDGRSVLQAQLDALPELPEEPTSFLEVRLENEFKDYARVFDLAIPSEQDVKSFLDLPQLHANQPVTRPEFLTLLTRIGTSNGSVAAKAKALDIMREHIENIIDRDGLDLQDLLPCVLSTLANPSQRVRRAAAELSRTMGRAYGGTVGNHALMCPVSHIYGAGVPRIYQLASPHAHKFLHVAVLPFLEDCVMDRIFISRSLVELLNPKTTHSVGKSGTTQQTQLRKELRHGTCMSLATHASLYPVLSVKIELLRVLNSAGKVARQAKADILLPFVKEWMGQSADIASAACSREGLSLQEMDKMVIASLPNQNNRELKTIREIAAGRYDHRPELAPLAFEYLRHHWTSLKHSQVELTDFLQDLVLCNSARSESSRDLALEMLRNLTLNTEVLEHLMQSLPNVTDIQDQPPAAKKQRTSRAESLTPRNVEQNKLQAAIRRITLILELVEGAKPKKHPQLLKPLFHVLSDIQHYKTLTGSELVYIQGMVLGCLLSIVDRLQAASSSDIDRSVVRTDLIVECVRSTHSTQIHNTALLLVSSLASWAPDRVLHSVMPLFTFMSSTLLRQSDEYSAHVTDLTVARVVPPLAVSLREKGKDLVTGASELLLSFTAAFEHIPLHRRKKLFENLIETLGPEETLFAVVAMLIERYPEDARVPAFVAELVNYFPVKYSLEAAAQYLDLVFDALKPKRGLSDVLLGLNEKDRDAINLSIETLLEKVAVLLQNKLLRKRIATHLKNFGEDANDIRSTYVSVLEKAMQLTRDTASQSSLRNEAAESVLTAVLGLLPTKDFIQSSAQLMQTGSDHTRQQVFRSLEARVMTTKRTDLASAQVFVDVLPDCCVFISNDQPAETRHGAITCIDSIVEKYGKLDRATVSRRAFFDAAKMVAGDAALGSTDARLRVISILCFASMVEVLGEECIPILQSVLKQTFGYLKASMEPESVDVKLRDAAFGLVNAVLDNLPWILSVQDLDQALTFVAHAAANSSIGESDNTSLNAFGSLATRNIGAPKLIAAIKRTWDDVLDIGAGAVQHHLGILHQGIHHYTKATVTNNAQLLFTILLEAFDLRRRLQSGDKEEGAYKERHSLVNRLALDVTLKLNDATFRPFFMRLAEWTTSLPNKEGEGRMLRAIGFYSFTLALFEQLKSIVTSYASFLLENALQHLQTSTTNEAKEQELLLLVLQTLSSSFQHDQSGFWQAPAHFDAVASQILKQLGNAKTVPVTEYVIQAITNLASAASSPEHYKSMNTIIMSYMRHQEAEVRLAAVKCERAITESLGLEWLDLLPEMLRVIPELQEDDNENVEQEALRWVKQIEEVSGESLEDMVAS